MCFISLLFAFAHYESIFYEKKKKSPSFKTINVQPEAQQIYLIINTYTLYILIVKIHSSVLH